MRGAAAAAGSTNTRTVTSETASLLTAGRYDGGVREP
jgi:hypothetical protein